MKRTDSDIGAPHVLSRDEAEALGRRILGVVASEAEVSITSTADASTDFARGDTHMASDGTSVSVKLTVDVSGQRASVMTTRLDDASLHTLVAEVTAAARQQEVSGAPESFLGPQWYPAPPKLFFDAVLTGMQPDARASLFRAATDVTEAAGLVAAGSVSFSLTSTAIMNTAGLFGYSHGTYGEFSLTARAKDGRASGWAWGGHEDWSRVDVTTVMGRAVDLALRSGGPVAVEPGRYTVILEPAAVAALLTPILAAWSAYGADGGVGVFAKEPLGTNKVGLQMMDQRLGMVSDPWDPDLPRSVVTDEGEALRKVIWFERGVLKNLEYTRDYARQKGHEMVLDPGGVRLTSGEPAVSLEEMIASTKRGIWVGKGQEQG